MGSTAHTKFGKPENEADPGIVKSVHFTNCQKPVCASPLSLSITSSLAHHLCEQWKCFGFPYEKGNFCKEMHKKWWDIRSEYESEHGLEHVKSCEIGKPYVRLQEHTER
jgi:hypothetical protein